MERFKINQSSMFSPMSNVPYMYKAIIDDVIQNVRNDFIHMGVDEQVLIDLRDLWEKKLLQTRIFSADEYLSSNGTSFNEDLSYSFVQQPEFIPSYYEANDNSDYFPQNDGPNNLTPKQLQNMNTNQIPQIDGEKEILLAKKLGIDLGIDRFLAESENEKLGSGDSGNEDDLGSDLDDEDEEDEEEDDPQGNIILCQYDKVTRTKSRWRCTLKDGVMHINGKDYLFHRATGEFEW